MKILPGGLVELEKGEVIPVQCIRCGRVYPPKPNTIASKCPACDYVTFHESQLWIKKEKRP